MKIKNNPGLFKYIIFGLVLCCIHETSSGQGIGSIQDYETDKNDSRLVSLKFNGRIYAPRPGSLPEEKYKAKCLNSEQSFYHTYEFRPIELFVSDDDGVSWKLATHNPLFELIHSATLITRLDLINEVAKMQRIDNNHFVLTTMLTINTTGSIELKNYPIIYVFKEDIREGYMNIEIKQVFRPEEINNNYVIDIATEGNKTNFYLNNRDTVTFTFNPSDKIESEFRDSRGNFSTTWKNK